LRSSEQRNATASAVGVRNPSATHERSMRVAVTGVQIVFSDGKKLLHFIEHVAEELGDGRFNGVHACSFGFEASRPNCLPNRPLFLRHARQFCLSFVTFFY